MSIGIATDVQNKLKGKNYGKQNLFRNHHPVAG